MMRILLLILTLAAGLPGLSRAETVAALMTASQDQVERASRQTIGPLIDAIVASGDPQAPIVLEAWGDRRLGLRKTDGALFTMVAAGDGWALTDLAGAPAGDALKDSITPLKPNAGVRGLIGSAMVRFQLSDPARSAEALASIARDPEAAHLEPLRLSIATETDDGLRARKARLERLLTIRFDPDSAARVAAIDSFGPDLGVDLRGALNPLIATTRIAGTGTPEGNIAQELLPGRDLTSAEAYEMLVGAGLAPARLTLAAQRAALIANLKDGAVGGVAVAELNDQAARDRAYTALEVSLAVPVAATDDEVVASLGAHRFHDLYVEQDRAVTSAARRALTGIDRAVLAMRGADLLLDALSLGSIYFLAAIGLAITFGVMRVINMAHGEFIMMGAYTGYVVQRIVPDPTLSILLALPTAFAVTFAAGVALERLVIRHLANRPLETLLATFGVSIALQQLAKLAFGTQARPLTAPSWLDGAWVLNDVVSISHIRIAIFLMAVLAIGLFNGLMTRSRLGLEVRAVTQNRTMAASMGIDPDRIAMLTFGLGSGIAGVAGVAIGLFAKVTSELGSDYIVQSFMTVVVGGVGNIWGTLAGALMIGGLQKLIELLNPSNTLAAQTYMILFIILFIQVRPRGIIALRGRAAGD